MLLKKLGAGCVVKHGLRFFLFKDVGLGIISIKYEDNRRIISRLNNKLGIISIKYEEDWPTPEFYNSFIRNYID